MDIIMKTKKSRSLFDEEFRLEKISDKKDPLEKLNHNINWEIFRPILNQVFAKEPKGKGGRPPYDYVMMFKILILQRYYNISDEQVEYQILDRLSFMRFLELSLSDNVPDCNTVWLFRENLTKSGAVEKLFSCFDKQLQRLGLIANEGSIIDASFVDVPRQRNSHQENKEIKENKIPDSFQDNKNILCHKDLDARWTKKNNETFYGYKNHIKVCKKTKLIQNYEVTDASVHDSQTLEDLIDETNTNKELYADSAYSGKPIANLLQDKEIINQIHEKGTSKASLTEEQKANNRIKSRTRVRVEHVFGFVEKNMNGSFIYTIGKIRARAVIGLMNLTYNLFRSIQLAI
jgi:transposase, IS5 family